MVARLTFAARATLVLFGVAAAILTMPASASATFTTSISVTGAGSVTHSRVAGVCTSPLSTATGVIGATCSKPYEYVGTARGHVYTTLVATAPDGWHFKHWTGGPCAGSTGASCTFAATCLGGSSYGCMPNETYWPDVSTTADFEDIVEPRVVFDAPPKLVVAMDGRARFAFHVEPETELAENVATTCAPDATSDGTACALEDVEDGEHTVCVTATDASGLNSQTCWTWDQDTPPNTVIASGPSAGEVIAATSATFGFGATKSPGRFECALDGGSWSACASPYTTNALAQGPHSFAVRSIDARDVADASPAQASWTVDTVAPETLIAAGPADGLLTNATDVFFSLLAEPGARFECRLDAEPFAPCPAG
jgi:hypothetical protein